MKNLNVIIPTSLDFLAASPEERLAIILSNRETRKELLQKSVRKSVAKKTTRKKKPKKMEFRTKELEDIFNSMPVEVQRFIAGTE